MILRAFRLAWGVVEAYALVFLCYAVGTLFLAVANHGLTALLVALGGVALLARIYWMGRRS